MTNTCLSSVFSLIVNWLSSLTVPVINVSALSVWVGIFLMAMGVWIIGNVYGIVMDFVHDAKNDERERQRDADRERRKFEDRAESAKLRMKTDDLNAHDRNVIQYNYWLYRSRGGKKW